MSRAVESEIALDARPEEVWQVVMDPHRLGDWVTTHAGLGAGAPSQLHDGSSFEQKLRVAGVTFTVTWTVTDCEPPRSVLWQGTGPGGSAARVSYRLEPVGDSRTRFTYQNRFELPGGTLGRLAGRAVGERVAKREAERTLRNLQALVERGGG